MHPRSERLLLGTALVVLGLIATARVAAAPPRVSRSTGTPVIQWTRVKGASAYVLTVRDRRGTIVYTSQVHGTSAAVALSPGTYHVRVATINIFGKVASASPWKQIKVFRIASPRPRGVIPGVLYHGTGVHAIHITGSGFYGGIRCEILVGHTLHGTIPVTKVTRARLVIRLDTNELPPDRYRLRLVNRWGTVADRLLPLRVVKRIRPEVRSMSRYRGYRNNEYRGVQVNGSGFVTGSVVALVGARARIKGKDVVVDSAKRLSVTIDVGGAPPGRYHLLVKNPGGISAILGRGFTVEAIGPPRFTSIQPRSVKAGRPAYTFTVRGEGFIPRTSFELERAGTFVPVALVKPPAFSSATILVAGHMITPGSYNLVVENGVNYRSTVAAAIFVRPVSRTGIEGMSVRRGSNAQQIQHITVWGRFLRSNDKFYLQRGTVLLRLPGRVVSPTRAKVAADLRRRPAGVYDLEVMDHGKIMSRLPGEFTIMPHRVPPRSFLTVQLGWPYTFTLPDGSFPELGDSWQGGDLLVGLNLGNKFLKPLPIVRNLGLMLNVGYNRLTGSNATNGSVSADSIWYVGSDLFYATRFDYPVNLIARIGWGLSFSSFSKSTALSTASGQSDDIYVQGGAGVKLTFIRRFPVEIGARFRRILYAGSNLDTLQVYVSTGVQLGI